MSKAVANSLVAGIIAAVIALLCWHFLADATWGQAGTMAALFFAGTFVVVMIVLSLVPSQHRRR